MYSALLTFAADEFKFFLENLTVALLRHENIHFFLSGNQLVILVNHQIETHL